jgi:hypothetical protein
MIETLFIISFWVYATSLGAIMLLVYRLFKSLNKNYSTYYKSIGKPRILAPVNLTEEGYTQTLRGGVFGYSMLLKGIPKNFPKDAGLIKLAQAIRITLAITLVLFITLVTFGYLFYKSTS